MTDKQDIFFSSFLKTANFLASAKRTLLGKTSRQGARTTAAPGADYSFKPGQAAKTFNASVNKHVASRGFANPALRQAMTDSGGRRAWADNTRKLRTYGRGALIGAGALGAGYALHRLSRKNED